VGRQRGWTIAAVDHLVVLWTPQSFERSPNLFCRSQSATACPDCFWRAQGRALPATAKAELGMCPALPRRISTNAPPLASACRSVSHPWRPGSNRRGYQRSQDRPARPPCFPLWCLPNTPCLNRASFPQHLQDDGEWMDAAERSAQARDGGGGSPMDDEDDDDQATAIVLAEDKKYYPSAEAGPTTSTAHKLFPAATSSRLSLKPFEASHWHTSKKSQL